MFEVVLSAEARRFLGRCDAGLRRRLERCFESLERDPREGNNIKRLTGPLAGAWRYRVGDHRVVYTIDDGLVRVSVITIAHRRDVYG